MEYNTSRTWLEIDLDAIAENHRRIKADIGRSEIIAVVKADAYGLGAPYISRFLEEIGVGFFAVACLEEAMELRHAGVKGEILTETAIKNNTITNIISLDHAEALSAEAVRLGKTMRGHLKLDAGMSRFGLILEGRMDAAVEEALHIANLPGLQVEGIFTHYTDADLPYGDTFNKHQIALFDEACEKLRTRGLTFKKHSASSHFTSVYPQCHNDYVRVGSLLLGTDTDLPYGTQSVHAVQLKSRIYQIKEVDAGRPVSYGPIAHTLRPSRIAVVPIGYADGLRRTIQNKASLIVNGTFVPLIGKICMDYLMLDVTDIDAKVGDVVTVFGRDGDAVQELWQMAELYGGTMGEVPTVITPRVPRIYIKDGKYVGQSK